MKTRDQERAQHALQRARDIRGKDAEFSKKLPVLIQTCGLAQAIAFTKAKGKADGLLAALEDWIANSIPPSSGRDMLNRIIAGEPDFLFRATDESLAYLFWISRFVEANASKANGGPTR